MRRTEVAQVHTADLVEDRDGYWLWVRGKGGKSRCLPLPIDLAQELRRAPSGYLFPGAYNGHLSPQWVAKRVRALLPADLTMHTLRHRFATRAYDLSKDLLTVQQLLGHANPATTQRYVRVPSTSLRHAVEGVASGSDARSSFSGP